MKKILFLSLVLATVVSCHRCNENLCADTGLTTIEFKVLDSTTLEDAFFGSNPKFEKDSLQAYTSDNHSMIRIFSGRTMFAFPDSVIKIVPFNEKDFILKYPGAFEDTIKTFTHYYYDNDKCCGGNFLIFDSVKLNNITFNKNQLIFYSQLLK